MAVLTQSQLTQFDADGFVALPSFCDAALTKQIDTWSNELVRRPEVAGEHMVYYEDSLLVTDARVLSRIENFCPYHPGFDQLLRGTAVMQLMESALREPAFLFKDKINFKVPGSDGFRAHQDVQAGWDVYAPLHLTLMISIDTSTVENGCLEIARGCPRGQLLGTMWEPLADPSPGIEYEAMPTAAGDAVVFDSFVPHRSMPNGTDTARRVLYVTYNAEASGDHRAQYYADKRRNFPPDCERDPEKTYAFRV